MIRKKEKRQYYLDNLRAIIVLGLFLFHACEIYHLDEGFYIEADKRLIPTLIYNFPSPWYMGVLFVIAGIASMHSLKKRSIKFYCIERIKRLFVPLVIGLICWVPFESYWVLKNHTDFHGNMLDAVQYFFTHGGLFSYGYQGEFSPSHLWFLLSLFVVSFVCLPIIIWKKRQQEKLICKFNTLSLILIILIIYVVSYGTSDESTLKFIVFFAVGVIFYDNEFFYKYIERNLKLLVCVAIICDCVASYFLIEMKYVKIESISYALMRMIWAISCVVSVFAVIGLGKEYLNYTNQVWRYLSNRSFAIYFIHMIPVIAFGYYIVTYAKIWSSLQIFIIMTMSFVVTILIVELLALLPIRELFKLKKVKDIL